MDVPVATRESCRQPGIQSVVVENADERPVQREDTDGQRHRRDDEPRLYFSGKRQSRALRGTSRL